VISKIDSVAKIRVPYRFLLLGNGCVVVAVMLIFKLIQDRQTAALVAGSLFLLSPMIALTLEWRANQSWRSIAAAGAILFFVGAAVPIFGLRIANWGEPFDQLSLFGISGQVWHKASNGLFLLMLVGQAWGSFQQKKKKMALQK